MTAPSPTPPELTQEERDILQEVMNIAFGQASADLAAVIDEYVVLHVPRIDLVEAEQVVGHLAEGARGEHASIVEQSFHGRFRGLALLLFPASAEEELARILGAHEDGDPGSTSRDVLLEVGNILIGACVGKVAELLGDVVDYDPPRVILHQVPASALGQGPFPDGSTVIMMRTVFTFENKELGGGLWLLCDPRSLDWLRVALTSFMERYAWS